ncbi:PucR family transcriptional regulator ligand-binding domain-containing protein [Aneurinibacillus sp. Ricciae_BoGa-3]|uniref:PucR family transcriptional regulator n=1 Tax=Aneurinibacillus sp. Ricciae_BoGa-3 TaxID=3022697 RepID=UPI002340FC79|nr:PucR family transcriptional regulator [Aneurinibacillus sp. Ricciae_BoGa-3]WCK53759.1 PucR family transcriptional regulator ligand-binding domain-containing protein [Aneurinibacillus sp. Ricciae_BoGa-3]
MLTLAEVLKMPCLKRAQVVAGASGLRCQISSVTVTDVPDFFQWLRGNEFILSTGFAFQGNEESLGQIIHTLKESNASGLGIKFNRYLTHLPESVRAISDELGIPIVSIPYESSWTDIINPIMTEIINLQAAQLQRSDTIRKRLIKQMLGQGGIREIACILEEFVENPVAIIDLASNQPFSNTKLPNLSETVLSSELYRLFEGESFTVVQHTPEIIRIHGMQSRIVAPIEAAGMKTGYIIILEQNRPFCLEDIIPLEQATIVAALEIEKMEEHRKAKRNLRHHLLRRILEDDSLPYLSAKLSFREVGWELGEHYLVFAVDVALEEQISNDQPRMAIQDINEYILRNCSRLFSSTTISGFDGEQHLIFLHPVNPTTLSRCMIDEFTRELKLNITQLIKEMTQEKTLISIGYGRFHPGFEGVRTTYKESVKALKIGSQIFGKNQIISFSELGLYRILYHDEIRQELKLFCEEMLEPLISDKKENNDLLVTLQVFLETGGNFRLTAKKLFVHHNTVRYRIETIERLCQVDLKNDTDRLNLAISLKTLPIFNKSFLS